MLVHQRVPSGKRLQKTNGKSPYAIIGNINEPTWHFLVSYVSLLEGNGI